MLNWLTLLVLGVTSRAGTLHSKSKKGYLMGKRKWTIGQTMNYKNKLPRKLKTEKQELKIGDELGCIDSSWFSWHTYLC
jgi:hypothetical protein